MTTATGRPLRWWRAKEKENYSCFLMWELLLSISGVFRKKLRIVHKCQEKKISCDDVRLLFTSVYVDREKTSKVS